MPWPDLEAELAMEMGYRMHIRESMPTPPPPTGKGIDDAMRAAMRAMSLGAAVELAKLG